MKTLLVLCSLAFASIACAENLDVAWNNPTVNADNTPIPASGPGSLIGANLEWGTCSSPGVFGTVIGSSVVGLAPGSPTGMATITGLTLGTTYCLRVNVINTFNITGAWSPTIQKTVTGPPTTPGAPFITSVT